MEILQSVAKQQRFSLTFIPLPQRILRLCPPNNSGAPTPLLGRWQFSDILSRRIPMRYIYKLDWLCLILCIAPLFLTAQNPTPGQNVNMVSGTKWPGGDPFLQRQNEPSIAVSTRNPLHLLAGANDYRTVDLNLVDKLPINSLAGDAWMGIFKSFDGGQRWQSTLLPGFPQDRSAFGAASPMKGFGAASDPVVRAGTNGMFYFSTIALNRGTN